MDRNPPPGPEDAFEALVIDGPTARARVRRAHAHRLCAGHFPGEPLLPGAQLLSLMADVVERLAAARGRADAQLAAVERCVFLVPLRPDDDIVVTAALRADGATADGEVQAGGVCAARATLRLGAPG